MMRSFKAILALMGLVIAAVPVYAWATERADLRNRLRADAASAEPYTLRLSRREAPARAAFARRVGAGTLLTSDRRSYALTWPRNTRSLPTIVAMGGHVSNAFDQFFFWQPYAAERGYRVIALHWRLGPIRIGTPRYGPVQIERETQILLRRLNSPLHQTMVQGHSNASVAMFAITTAALLRDRPWALSFANAGGFEPSFYPPNASIARGRYGRAPLRGSAWALFCAGRDPNPQSAGCPAMVRSYYWVGALGGRVVRFVYDPRAGHSGVYVYRRNAEAILDAFDARRAQLEAAPELR